MNRASSNVTTEPQLVRVACPLCDSPASRYEREINGFRLERCQACGFVFVNPQWPPQSIDSQYETREEPQALLAHYERVYTPAKVLEYDEILRRLRRHCPGGRRLLDVGCGPGYFLKQASGQGWEVHGIDLAPWVVHPAREMGLADIRIGRLEEMHFPDASFDVVHAAQVLEHLQRPRTELAEMRRILKPDGILYINVPNYRCLSIVLGRDDFVLNQPMAHVNYFTPRALRRLLAAAGFEVLAMTTFGGLKWENILGRPYLSEEVKSVRGMKPEPDAGDQPAHSAESAWEQSRGVTLKQRLKRWIRPPAEFVLYRLSKLAMSLEAIARRTES